MLLSNDVIKTEPPVLSIKGHRLLIAHKLSQFVGVLYTENEPFAWARLALRVKDVRKLWKLYY